MIAYLVLNVCLNEYDINIFCGQVIEDIKKANIIVLSRFGSRVVVCEVKSLDILYQATKQHEFINYYVPEERLWPGFKAIANFK